jgi:hypothetical protein
MARGGTFWARKECKFNGNGQGRSVTGDYGNKLSCCGAEDALRVSVTEITLSGGGRLDFYDVSLVDGFNLPVQVRKCLRNKMQIVWIVFHVYKIDFC